MRGWGGSWGGGGTHLALDVGDVELPGAVLRHHLQDVGVLEGALIHPLHRPHLRHGDGAAHLETPKHRGSLHPPPRPGTQRRVGG